MNDDVNHRSMKLWWEKNPSLDVIIGKTAPKGSKGVIRHYHYMLDPRLVPGVVSPIIITCSYYACTT